MANEDTLLNLVKNLGSPELIQAAQKTEVAVKKIKEKTKEATEAVKEFGAETIKSIQSFNNIDSAAIDSLIKKTSRSNEELVAFGSQSLLVQQTLKKGFSPEAFSSIGEAAKESTSNINETLDSVNKLLGIDINKDNPIAKTLRSAESLIKLGDSTREFEMGLISTAAASGQLGDLLESVGDDFNGLILKSEQFSRITYELANASGLGQKQVAGYAKELMTIPGAMDTVVKSQEEGIADMHLLDATMKIGVGSGVGFTQTMKDLSFQYSELGTTGKQALDYTARLSAVSQELKMPMENVRSYTEGAARSFRYLGDNTQSAINIFERFAPTLQKGGLGVRAVSDLIGGVTQNISQMGIAQKSFLSSQTGGPGGLQGGYQVELLMKQGKVDDVYKKVEQSLRKQFGGRIVTLEEAAADNRAAGQFTKQVQMLTQGPTKIASSDQEAYRILDVLAKGGPEKAGPKTDSETAFRSALKVGDELQERQTNILSKIENETQRGTQLASISAYNLTRLALGTEREGMQTVISASRDKSSETLGTAEAGKLFTGVTHLEGGQTPAEVIKDYFGDFEAQTRDGKSMITEFFSNFTNIGKEEINKILPEGFGSQISAAAKQKASEAKDAVKDKVEVTVQTICEKCNLQTARTEATRIAGQTVDRRDTNRALAVHTGVDHGH